ncbi:MAG TPA: SDR family oxidoreductase [Thermoplasmata archaeon]|nr:SDR family oxidoreductase [Thermoplasmata archaeon]
MLSAEHGAFVGINYHENEDAAKDVLKKIHGLKGGGVLLKGDVSSTWDVNRMVQQLVEQRKHIDVLVLNAGIYKRSSFAALSREQWDETVAVNLTGCFNVCKAALPCMREGSSII